MKTNQPEQLDKLLTPLPSTNRGEINRSPLPMDFGKSAPVNPKAGTIVRSTTNDPTPEGKL
jgi:hypothetical protein